MTHFYTFMITASIFKGQEVEEVYNVHQESVQSFWIISYKVHSLVHNNNLKYFCKCDPVQTQLISSEKQEETLRPTEDTETLRNHETRTRTQDREAEWMWCWRCGGGSVSQRRLCRRTESQQDSPHTLLLYQRQRRRRWMLFCYCDGQSNHHQSRTDSRTDHYIQTHSHHCLLSSWFLCNSLI